MYLLRVVIFEEVELGSSPPSDLRSPKFWDRHENSFLILKEFGRINQLLFLKSLENL